jgi:hypothetical protein
MEDRELKLDNALKEHDYSPQRIKKRRRSNYRENKLRYSISYKGIDGGQKVVGFLIQNRLKNCIQEF